MSGTTGRRSPTLSECTQSNELNVSFSSAQGSLETDRTASSPPCYSKAIVETLRCDFVPAAKAMDTFKAWVESEGLSAALQIQDERDYHLEKYGHSDGTFEWAEVIGVCLETTTAIEDVKRREESYAFAKIVEPSTQELEYPIGLLRRSNTTIDGRLQEECPPNWGYWAGRKGRRYYAQRLIVIPRLYAVDEEPGCVGIMWGIVFADLHSCQKLVLRKDLHKLP